MRQRLFVERGTERWERLDRLLDRAGKRGIRRLPPAEVESLGRYYRATTSDLAYARGRGYDPRLLGYLNRLVARSHAYVYGGAAETGFARIGRFYAQTFPREFRRSLGTIAICAALTIVGAIVAYAAIGAHPDDAFSIIPGMVPPEIKKSLHDSNFAFDSVQSPLVSSEIITNNVKVAILAFAGSVTLGLLTVWIIIQNGLMLGGIAALFNNAGFGYDFWATVAPHGVIELTAIQIAGAAGLLVGAAIVAPGRLRRRDAVRENAKRAGVLFAGVASMLVVAGTIEGFFSPLRLAPEIRIAFGALTAVALVLYFALAGRVFTGPRSRTRPGR